MNELRGNDKESLDVRVGLLRATTHYIIKQVGL